MTVSSYNVLPLGNDNVLSIDANEFRDNVVNDTIEFYKDQVMVGTFMKRNIVYIQPIYQSPSLLATQEVTE